jgi:hypothetical protein
MFEMLLGHLVGDYLLQNKWMALSKSKNTLEGWVAAFIHCSIYTFSVCLLMWNFDWYWMLIVFHSHFWIDKFSLAEKYKKLIGGSTLKEFVHRYEDGLDNIRIGNEDKPMVNRREIVEGGFATLIYTISDNTMHLLLMWGAFKLIY